MWECGLLVAVSDRLIVYLRELSIPPLGEWRVVKNVEKAVGDRHQ